MRGPIAFAPVARVVALVLAIGLLPPGCRAPVPGEQARHIVMFDGEGAPVDLTDRWGGALLSYRSWDQAEYAAHVERVVMGLRDHVERTGSRKVLVFIHGGLNEQPETIRRAVDLSDEILADDVYPIFVNWQSNLVSSYFAHLLFVRQGRDWGGWGVILAPFYLATDLARSVFRFPVVAGHQVAEGLGSLGALELTDRTHARDATRELMRSLAADGGADGDASLLRLDIPQAAQGFHGRLSGSDDLGLDDVGYAARYAVTLPFKPVSIFVVDAAGTGSWEVMRRRVELLFQRQEDLEDFDSDQDGRPRVHRKRDGLLLLMYELAALQQELDLEITLVGHSMGTIVLNRLLFYSQMYGHIEAAANGSSTDAGAHAGHASHAEHAEHPEHAEHGEIRLPEFSNVVYMAAACSLRDYEQSAFSYLLHDARARLFHVVLDPDEELDEDNAWDLAPRGSLLVWVDDFLAQPATLMDRTAGRYDNLMVALANTPRTIRHQIHVRVLSRGEGDVPAKHGQFTDPDDTDDRFRFWKREAWWRWWEGDEPVPAPRSLIDEQAFPQPDAGDAATGSGDVAGPVGDSEVGGFVRLDRAVRHAFAAPSHAIPGEQSAPLLHVVT